ncbi:MAG: hypothetical protein GY869_17695 [Planctomycetes bacterium]|nr:hypothetical protein [Planctomycetota bacterium]
MIIAAIGATCLGAIVGWLVRYFISRLEKYTHQGLSAIVGVLLGTGVIKFLDQNPDVVWFYPIGLVVGFAVYHFTAAYYISKDQKDQKDQKNDDNKPEGGGSGGGGGGEAIGKRQGPLYAPMKDFH